MDTTIADAWAEMLENQPLRASDIDALFNQVAGELIEAACPGEGGSFSGFGYRDLSEEYSMEVLKPQNIRGYQLSLIVMRRSGGTFGITVRVEHSQNRLVINRGEGGEEERWDESYPPQKTWILRELREGISAFLKER